MPIMIAFIIHNRIQYWYKEFDLILIIFFYFRLFIIL